MFLLQKYITSETFIVCIVRVILSIVQTSTYLCILLSAQVSHLQNLLY